MSKKSKIIVGYLALGILSSEVTFAGEFYTSTGETIPNQYIVILDSSPGDSLEKLQPSMVETLVSSRVTVTAVWNSAVNGFVAKGLDEKTAKKISTLPGVISVEPDSIAYPNTIQYNAPVGLDAIDQRGGALSGTYTYNYTAPLVHAYVIDTGIRVTHVDFGGRAQSDGNFTGDNCGGSGDVYPGGQGHGTGVASIIGGATYGVAKQVRIHSLRVYNCQNSGGASNTISALNWIVQHGLHPGVVNISSNFSPSPSLDAALNSVISANFFVTVSAGNGGNPVVDLFDDACGNSPARVPSAFTVAAPASFSSRGVCIDMFAPGVGVPMAAANSDTDTTGNTGTSFSAPHAAGVAALILQQFPSLGVEQISWELVARSTKNLLIENDNFHLYNSPNRYLYSLSLNYSAVPTVPASLDVSRCNTSTLVGLTGGSVSSANIPTYFEIQTSTSTSFATTSSRYSQATLGATSASFPALPVIYVRARSCNSLGCSAFKAGVNGSCGGHQ